MTEMKNYSLQELTSLLQTLKELSESGVKVNREINAVLGLTMMNLGMHNETLKAFEEK